MKRIFSIALLLCCLLTGLAAEGQVYTPDNLPMVHLRDARRYVCDPEHILNATATDSIDRMLYQLEQRTGVETVVAVVPSIGQADCFDFCHQLLNQQGVGKKGQDNGLIVLLVIDQRCIQFYTGYGLEGILPDAICKRIQTQTMLPYLKEGRWSEALTAGMRATCQRLTEGSPADGNGGITREQTDTWAEIIIVIAFILFCTLVGYLAVRRSGRCPQCGKHKLKRASSRLVSFHNGIKTEDVTYICQHCGHVVTRREQHGSGSNHGRGGRGGGPIIFGGGFGGFGGFGSGGFGGGSFGGGSGGGGGAGTRF